MNGFGARVLIVDDDEGIRGLLQDTLACEGYETLEAPDGATAVRILENEPPDLVILDIIMPGMDGLEVLHSLRLWSRLPVIMLSGRTEEKDKICCLKAGADDYVTRPLAEGELLARIEAVLRRTDDTRISLSAHILFDDGHLRIDLGARKITIAGEEVALTRLEYSLLQELATAAGKVAEYEPLQEAVWDEGYQDAKDTLRHLVNSLRKKIEPDPQNPGYIINVPGVGYRFNNGR